MDMNKEGGFIFQASDSRNFPVNISITSTVVSDFNRDHPYLDTYIGDSGFLNLMYVTSLIMSNVTFMNNLLFTSLGSNQLGFNRIGSVEKQVFIDNVSFFRTMGGTSGLISINDEGLGNSCDEGARVVIKNLKVYRSSVANLGSFVLIKTGFMMFLEIDGVSFEENSSQSMTSMLNVEMSDSFFSKCTDSAHQYVKISNIDIIKNLVGTEQNQSNIGYIMITNLINSSIFNISILNNIPLTLSSDINKISIIHWILSNNLHPLTSLISKTLELTPNSIPIAFSSGQVQNISITKANFRSNTKLSRVVMFGAVSPNLVHRDIYMNDVNINNTGYGIFLSFNKDVGIIRFNNCNIFGTDIALYTERNEPAVGRMEINNSIISNSGISSAFAGGLYLTSGEYCIRNCTFTNIKGLQGSAIYLYDIYTNYTSTLLVEDSNFKSNIGFYQAGDLMIQKKNLNDPANVKLIIRRSRFEDAFATLNASSLLFRADFAVGSVISDSYFRTGGIARGGVMLLSIYKGELTFMNNIIEKSGDKSERSSIIYNTSNGKVIIKNTTFINCTATNIIRNERRLSVPSLELENCRFENNTGTMIYNVQGNINDTGSVYYHNSNSKYTVYSGSFGSNASFEYIDVSYNYADEECAGFYMEGPDSRLCIKHSRFRHNQAAKRAAVLTVKQNPKSIQFYNTTFIDNYAPTASAFNVISAVDESLLVQNCNFMRNKGDSLIYLSATTCNITDTLIQDNLQISSHAGITVTETDLYIHNSTFRSQTGSNGCLISSLNYNKLEIYNSIFEDSICDLGVVDMMSSELSLYNSVFSNITGKEGVLINTEFKSRVYVLSSIFKDIYIDNGQVPGIIKLSNTKSVVYDSIFENYLGSAILASHSSEVEIMNTRFARARNATFGGGMYCDKCKSIRVSEAWFENLEAVYGGALYLRAQNEEETYVVENSFFENCAAGEAGALYADQVSVNVSSSRFISNSASLKYEGDQIYKGKAGALYLSCDTEKYPCKVHIEDTVFRNNSAGTNGGALYFDTFEPYLYNCSFVENTAVYGKNHASFPLQLKFMEGELAAKKMLHGTGSGSILNIQLKVGIFDAFEQLITSNSYSEAILQSDQNNTKVSGSIISRAVNGIFTFSNFSITSKPGSTTSISAHSQSIQSNKQHGIHSVSLVSSTSVEVDIEMRNCYIGEIEIGYECRSCPPKTYSLEIESKVCTACPSSA
jgi:predicted outer membrane repeat protein